MSLTVSSEKNFFSHTTCQGWLTGHPQSRTGCQRVYQAALNALMAGRNPEKNRAEAGMKQRLILKQG